MKNNDKRLKNKYSAKKLFSALLGVCLIAGLSFSICFFAGCDRAAEETLGDKAKAVSLSANGHIDEIENYIIRITPESDATLKMQYYIEWKVLNDEKEGPLEWVKIGVPNKYVYDITFGGDVEKAEYYSDSGAFIRADLNRKFYAGQIAKIEFSFTQKRIFTKTKNADTVEYGFIPGWFNEIDVKNLEVYWKDDAKIIYSNDSKTDGEWLLWQKTDLKAGESIKVEVKYPLSFFADIDLSKGYSSSSVRFIDVLPFIIFFALFVAFVVTAVVVPYAKADGYTSYRGYYGRGYRGGFGYYGYPFWVYLGKNRGVNGKGKKMPVLTDTGARPSSGGSHGSGGSLCACACACAGGGRAGCSRKDFYNSQTNEFISVLNRKKLEK